MPYSFGGNNYKQQNFLAQSLLNSGKNNASPLASGISTLAGALLAGRAANTQKEDNQRLAEMLMGASTPQERAKIAMGSSDPKVQQLGMAALLSNKQNRAQSTVGKIQADLAAGLITPEQAQAQISKANTVTPLLGAITPYQQAQLGLQERKIAAQEKKAATGMALPRPVVNDLAEKAGNAEGYGRLIAAFNPDYAGYKNKMVGEFANTAKRTFGDDTGQAQWWQDYDLQASVVRNKLFGSALTAPEIAAWEKAAINPGMDSKQIQQNLRRQHSIVQGSLNRLANVYRKGGYSQDQINAIMGSIGGGTESIPTGGSIDANMGAQGGGSMLPQVQPGQSVAEAAAGGVGGGLPPAMRNDPRVLKAKQAGYSDEEIMQYLGGR